MAHRSIDRTEPTDLPPDPFWDDARLHVPNLVERLPRGPRWWAAAALGVVAIAGIGWWLLHPAAAPVESTVPLAAGAPAGAAPTSGGSATATSMLAGSTTSTVPDLVVQAAGEIQRPGLYRLPPGSRLDDLVQEAGGFTRSADRDRVNLAAPVSDGERVWIPSPEQTDPPPVVAGGGGGGAPSGDAGAGQGGGGDAPTPTSPVDLNTATAEQLDALPGVGPATATAILAYRDQTGRFGSVDDLLEVRGIGEAKLEQLRPLVHV